eukprot:SAG11_NODE_4282_length_1969_cov_1.565775_3_plen_172_part_00
MPHFLRLRRVIPIRPPSRLFFLVLLFVLLLLLLGSFFLVFDALSFLFCLSLARLLPPLLTARTAAPVLQISCWTHAKVGGPLCRSWYEGRARTILFALSWTFWRGRPPVVQAMAGPGWARSSGPLVQPLSHLRARSAQQPAPSAVTHDHTTLRVLLVWLVPQKSIEKSRSE